MCYRCGSGITWCGTGTGAKRGTIPDRRHLVCCRHHLVCCRHHLVFCRHARSADTPCSFTWMSHRTPNPHEAMTHKAITYNPKPP